MAAVLAHLPAICLPSQMPERIFIHVTLLSTTWCFVQGFAIVFDMTLLAHVYILDWDTETFYNIAIASCAEGLALHFSAYFHNCLYFQ